jgi:nuclear transport factor 2 (NTF2) superfamily protein
MKLPEKIHLTEEYIQRVFNEIDQFEVELNTVDYNESLFKGYKRIVIVGPQRSGTTFTSQALSNTLKFRNVDEGEFSVRDVNMFRNIMKQENIVIQAPAMTCRIQALIGKDDLVVFMSRKWSDIVKGVHRKNKSLSNWIFMETMFDAERYYFNEYDNTAGKFFDKYVNKNSYYLDAYYNMWKHYQSKVIPNCITLKYESMKNHPMWLDKSQRKNFGDKQTTL